MEYIIRRTSDHLEHHGILGQKWGVRRFQNPDGSLTAEGKARYRTEMKQLGEELLKAKDHKTVYDKLKDSQAVKEFNENSKNYQKLQKINELKKKEAQMLSDEINKRLRKDYGDFLSLDSNKQAEYVNRGIYYMQLMTAYSSRYQGLLNRQASLSKRYEKEAKKFISDCFEEIGSQPVAIPTALTVNLNTGKVSTSSLNDTAAIEMLRAAGGRI